MSGHDGQRPAFLARPPSRLIGKDLADFTPDEQAAFDRFVNSLRLCSGDRRPIGNRRLPRPIYLRMLEVARLLHVSPKTASRWAEEGRLSIWRPWVVTAASRSQRSRSTRPALLRGRDQEPDRMSRHRSPEPFVGLAPPGPFPQTFRGGGEQMKLRAFFISAICLAILMLGPTMAFARIIPRPSWRPNW